MQDINMVEQSGLFSEKFYLERYPEVKALNMAPVAHYVKYGWLEGKDPNVYFSTKEYLAYYPDVAAMQICPLVHFVKFGNKGDYSLYKDNHDFSIYSNVEICNTDNINYESLKNIRACVLIHVYYTEGIEEIAEYLGNVPEYIDVYISSDTDEKLNVFREYLSHNISGLNIEFVKVLNKGRDTGALLVGFNDIVRKYDYFAFLHYKKSPNSKFGRRWRHFLFDNLLGSKDCIESVLSDFTNNEKLGIIFPPVFPSFMVISLWDINANKVNCDDFLQNKLGYGQKINIGYKFPIGSMFWARTKSVLDLFDLHLSYAELDVPYQMNVAGKVCDDGSMLHCIERLWCIVAEKNNYEHKEVLFKNIPCIKPVAKKRIAIFCCRNLNYNAVLYKNCLEKIADKVILLLDSDKVTEDGLVKQELSNEVILRTDKGLNFVAWQNAMDNLGSDYLESFEELILCDDKCIFPLYDLNNVFSEMENNEFDFWGINGIYGGDIKEKFAQSNFYVFKKQVFTSDAFKNFFEHVQERDGANITYYENRFSRALFSAGFKHDCYYNFFLRDMYPLSLFIAGSPLIPIRALQTIGDKINLFYDFVYRVSKHDLRAIPLFKNIIK